MNIAELFVSLGIKGAEKTVSSLQGVEKGLKGTAAMSLEAKAAIIGAMYALEQFFAKSGAAGTDLTNFNAILGGKTVQTLQQYQFAARQVGISNQETESTFKSLQSTMTKLKLGEGAPKGFAQVAMLTGGITTQDVDKFMQNPELLIQRLQQYAQKEKRVGIRNEVLKSFGLGDNMVAALARQAFQPNVLAKAPTYSDHEIMALDKANIAWSNLGNKIAMAIGHLNAARGGKLVNDISEITDKVLQLTGAFLKLSEQLKLFHGLGKVFEGLNLILGGASNFAGSNTKTEDVKGFFSELPGIFSEFMWSNLLPQDAGGTIPTATIPKKNEASEKTRPDIRSFFQPPAAEKTNNDNAGLFKSIIDNSIGKNPSIKIPESSVTKIENNKVTPVMVPGKESKTVIGKESTKTIIAPKASPSVPALKLVVPSSPLLPSTKQVTPNLKAPEKSANNQNINVNQNLNFAHEGKESKQTGESVKRAVSEAFRQMSSQIQGS